MFNNLIESSSHAKEFKRRGSFLLFTTATYLALFVVTGVVSIYAYDAHLEEQNLEVVTLLPPQEIVPDTPPSDTPPADRGNRDRQSDSPYDTRRSPTASIDQPQLAPDKVSTNPNPNLPVRQRVPFKISDHDSNALFPGGDRGVVGTGNSGTPIKILDDEPPPAPAPTPVVPKIVRRSVVLNGDAVSLPKPNYPPLARNIKLQGSVNVQVLIDESGKVVSAKAVSGHPLFVSEAQRAAMQARFSPTSINGQPVKISGVITYNFVMTH